MTERPCVYSGRDGKHYGADRDQRGVAASDWNEVYDGPTVSYEKTSDQLNASEKAQEEFDVGNEFDGGEM